MKDNIKKLTFEDKFERKWWVDNRAKRVWVRFEKRMNRRKFRREMNKDTLSEVNDNDL